MASTICARTPELCSLIISHLITSESVAVYATVSREWRSAIERHSFSTLHLNQSRLADFVRIVTGPRCHAVRRLRFDIVLDAYSTDVRGCFETREEQERNNVVFTEAIQTLFSHLGTWRPQDVIENGIELSLKAYSPSDPSRMEKEALRERLPRARHRIDGRDLLARRFTSSYLRLVTTETNSSQQELLPVVSIITKLKIEESGYIGARVLRYFWPASAFLIASKLPRLFDIDFNLWDTEKKDLALRMRARDEFAKSLPSVPSSVRVFSLKYPYIPPEDQTFLPPNIIPTGDSDLFSTSLRMFSQQLTSLNIYIIGFSLEFFWPLDSDLTPQNIPHWPYLTSLSIFYIPVTPYGKWLFERDPAKEVDDDRIEGRDLSLHMEDDELPPREDWNTDIFREKPSARLMNDFYLAAGRALAKMPRLREMTLVAEKYGAEHSLAFRAMDSTASLTLWSTPPFEPEATVLDVWREAVKRNTGAELEITYLTEVDI